MGQIGANGKKWRKMQVENNKIDNNTYAAIDKTSFETDGTNRPLLYTAKLYVKDLR